MTVSLIFVMPFTCFFVYDFLIFFIRLREENKGKCAVEEIEQRGEEKLSTFEILVQFWGGKVEEN